MSDALKFENVGKNFRNFNALDDVTFSVKKGNFMLLLVQMVLAKQH